MSRSVTIDGESYTLPTGKDRNWLADFNTLMLALIDTVNGLASVDGAPGSIVSFGASTVRNGTADGFLWQWGGDQDAISTADQIIIIPVDGTLSKLRTRLNTAVSDVNATFTVRKNGVDTALACTIAAAGQTGTDAANTVSVVAGDRVSLKVVNSGTPSNTVQGPRASLLFTPAAETP